VPVAEFLVRPKSHIPSVAHDGTVPTVPFRKFMLMVEFSKNLNFNPLSSIGYGHNPAKVQKIPIYSAGWYSIDRKFHTDIYLFVLLKKRFAIAKTRTDHQHCATHHQNSHHPSATAVSKNYDGSISRSRMILNLDLTIFQQQGIRECCNAIIQFFSRVAASFVGIKEESQTYLATNILLSRAESAGD
jgi:hypothetical protein